MVFYFNAASMLSAAVFLAATGSSSNNNNSCNAIELTPENFDEMTTGKTVFLKFYAPWCGHCKSMAEDWSKLEKDFEGHEVAFVGSVDCTDDDNDIICAEFNVEGFPTVAWGDASSAQQYQGDRDYASLKAFADEFVTKPVCSISQLDACTEEEKAKIAATEAKSDDELMAAAQAIADLAKEEEKKYDVFVDSLQTQYEQRTKEHNDKMTSITMENDVKYIEQVLKKRNLNSPFRLDDLDGLDDDDDDDLMGGGEL